MKKIEIGWFYDKEDPKTRLADIELPREHANHLIAALPKDKTAFDIQLIVFPSNPRFGNRLFGESTNSLSPSPEKESKAAKKADSNYNPTVPAQVDNHGVYESGLLSSEAPWIPKPWTYIPFNGGPRICIGQQFALAEMGYTLVKIFQKYSRLERRMKEEDCDVMRANIVLTPARGVTVVFLKNWLFIFDIVSGILPVYYFSRSLYLFQKFSSDHPWQQWWI